MNIETFEHYVTLAAVAVAAITPLAHALLALARALHHLATFTASRRDDAFLAKVVGGLTVFVEALGQLTAHLPRLTVATPVTRPRASVPIVTSVLLAFVLMQGCAGTHVDQTRTILLATDGYVDRIDARVGPLLDAAHERAELEASDREDYDRRMRPWNAVRAALDGVQVSLVSAATTVDAVEAGQDRDIRGSIACAVEALMQLTALLPTVDVDVPPLLQTGIALLQSISSGFCPSPAAESPATPEPAPDPDEVTS